MKIWKTGQFSWGWLGVILKNKFLAALPNLQLWTDPACDMCRVISEAKNMTQQTISVCKIWQRHSFLIVPPKYLSLFRKPQTNHGLEFVRIWWPCKSGHLRAEGQLSLAQHREKILYIKYQMMYYQTALLFSGKLFEDGNFAEPVWAPTRGRRFSPRLAPSATQSRRAASTSRVSRQL